MIVKSTEISPFFNLRGLWGKIELDGLTFQEVELLKSLKSETVGGPSVVFVEDRGCHGFLYITIFHK